MEGNKDTVTPQEAQIAEMKPRRKSWGTRFKELSFWTQLLTTVAIFILAQAAISAAIQGIFDSLPLTDGSVLDVYRNAAITFGSLAAICFGWARAVEDDARSKDQIVEAGELFLRAAIFTLVALLFRAYALQNMPKIPVTEITWQSVAGFISLATSILVTVFVCLLDALKGIIAVAFVLQNRAKKRRQSRA